MGTSELAPRDNGNNRRLRRRGILQALIVTSGRISSLSSAQPHPTTNQLARGSATRSGAYQTSEATRISRFWASARPRLATWKRSCPRSGDPYRRRGTGISQSNLQDRQSKCVAGGVHNKGGRLCIGDSSDSTIATPSTVSMRGVYGYIVVEGGEEECCLVHAVADVPVLAPVPRRPTLRRQIRNLNTVTSRQAPVLHLSRAPTMWLNARFFSSLCFGQDMGWLALPYLANSSQ